MSKKTLHDYFRSVGMTEEGIAGLWGSIYAESTGKSNIAQRGMTQMTDQQYTVAADNGVIDFVRDSVGYGLCQWTSSDRKAALLAFAKNKGVSVGDEMTQAQFIVREMQRDYPTLFLLLCTSHDINECADRVCDKYERPAINNYTARRKYAHEFYNEFVGSNALTEAHKAQEPEPLAPDACPIFPPDPSVMTIQLVMQYNGYWGKPDGYKSPEFFSALRTFTDDMEKC